MSYRFLNEAQKNIFDNTIPRFVLKEDFAACLHQANPTAKPPAPNPNSLSSLWYIYSEKTKSLANEDALTATSNPPPPPPTSSETPLSGWEPTPPPATPTPTPIGFEQISSPFKFRPTRGNLSFSSSSRNRTQSPSKRTATGPPSPDAPGPDEMELTPSPPAATSITPQQVQDLLATIAELRKDLNKTQEEVSRLSKQIGALKASPPPPPPPPAAPKPPKAKKAAPPPPKSFAAVAATGPPPPQTGWTKVEKKTRPPPIFKPDYTKVQRELIVELSSPIPTGITDYAIITAANAALTSTEVKFCLARRTTRGNILLLTRPNTAASAAEAYIPSLAAALTALGCVSSTIHTNARWTQFLLHGIPTSATPQEITEEIRDIYPSLPPMAQTPRWLTNPTARKEKTMSTMVISFATTTNLESFGLRSMTLLNHVCRLGIYLPTSPSTQCTKCQAYGHHTTKCASPSPRCAVCAADHLTSAHPCKSCKGGPQCVHPPTKCVNCPLHPGHRANDPACPSRVKAIIRQPRGGTEVVMTS